MKRFKELLAKLWAGLDGNKTILGTTLFAVLTKFPLPEPYHSILITIISIWTGVSAYDHFKVKKMYSPGNTGRK
jgi:hypothetical protein